MGITNIYIYNIYAYVCIRCLRGGADIADLRVNEKGAKMWEKQKKTASGGGSQESRVFRIV